MLLTTPELCERLRIDRKTLYKMRDLHGLPYLELAPRVHRYLWDDVLEWLKTRAPETSTEKSEVPA